ncbi:MAG TPA: UDP-2,3-diacylglucosamine diphosphatase [Luteibaculaceae bacterium]|nr:UDP-2,3-diacylglucosamine diphosphatase [Luteibaculaceae bacterium]
MTAGKKIYFNSDYHLGIPNARQSRERELRVVRWLDSIKHDAEEIYLLGDLFDFWFEYQHVIPKGFVRLQGKIAELSDSGIRMHFFVGNHDLWVKNYFEEELGLHIHRDNLRINCGSKRFFIHHGDGKGPNDKGYKRMKKVFTNPFFQWCFRWLHPDLGVGLAHFFSRRSSAKTRHKDAVFLGEDQEWLVQYAKRKYSEEPADFFVFGHRHLPLEIAINPDATYINLGDWISHFTYAEFDGEQLRLKRFEG